MSILILLTALLVACAPAIEVTKLGNEYVQSAYSRNWWAPNYHRVTYCWKLDANGYCPKEDTRVEVDSRIGMDSPGKSMAVAAVGNIPIALALGLGLSHIPASNNYNRMTQTACGPDCRISTVNSNVKYVPVN